ncbi:S8 family serine peptidase [Oscillatoria sp. FACHB-1407]|uniref:S8 family peptidase n=1 Tax=Oscillatoria sp. FACHB-1407 TaxID=2692847 RepID=UPI0016879F71|nr:S8 family peptidase [Oscillatoria sp. FACHB-1407]MBD2465646.1 S8 family serine peptidase [Oscillatoria sp. FACHB-1407]
MISASQHSTNSTSRVDARVTLNDPFQSTRNPWLAEGRSLSRASHFTLTPSNSSNLSVQTALRSRRVTTTALPRATAIRPNQRLTGSLSSSDRRNPKRPASYSDDFTLRQIQVGQQVTASLTSGRFDAFLQVINAANGRVITQNDDIASGNSNSRVTFTVKAGITYRLRVTSYDGGDTGSYTLVTRTSRSRLPGVFDRAFGYGLVDAGAAVARALGRSTSAEVANLGGNAWNLDLVRAPEAWAQGFRGQGITVAVLDTGVDYLHSDLRDNIWTNPGEIDGNGIDDDNNGYIDDIRGWNFVDGSTNNPMDLDSHGTHVAGAIAAVNNGFGATGVAYDAKIMPVKVIGGREDRRLSTFDANVAAGIRYAVLNGARVLNLSLGNNPGDPPMPETEAALRFAKQFGAIAIMASGNEKLIGAIQPIYPALYASSNLGVGVGAIDIRRRLASFSNPAGDRPLDFVVAPGVTVYSTVPGDQFDSQNWSGTSMASPHVAGVAALILSANPNLTVDQVESILAATANPNGIIVS